VDGKSSGGDNVFGEEFFPVVLRGKSGKLNPGE